MHRLASAFSDLSPAAKLGALGVAGVGVVAVITAIYPRLWWVMLLGVLLIALLLVVYHAVLRWREKRKADPFEKEVVASTGSTPKDISDVNQRARLDDLRRAFEQGVATFRAAGKDLYSLPWYMIAGEPGSGKTEVLRRSNVPFPPGLQDTLQGTGGTINMNWWFTNHAVILDTAGRLMFEQVTPGTTSEWNEFLRLLNRTRPNCPVNGLMLVIPADSLISDSSEEIQKKAGQIAVQLANIQRTLEVRFPVFVIVTKCDLIAGFREFFDGIDDIDLQHQMFGWSNPGALDDPFQPEQIDEYLRTVRQRLEQRRMSLLLDPVSAGEDAETRRIDQVDSLYDFTDSFQRLAPRLQQYLGSVFVTGEWSAKPLFLRGIYFTSSLREGKALDSMLAEALGVAPEDLPEDRPWERDRAYFLRDLFLNKIFKESRLVTRAGNTRRLRQQRRAALLGAGSVAVLALCVLTWFSFGAFQDRVGGHSEAWDRLAAALPDLPPLAGERRAGTGVYAYNGHEHALEHEGEDISVAGLPDLSLRLASAGIEVPAVFRLVAGLDRDLLHDQRFEAHDALVRELMLTPVVEGVAEKLRDLDGASWSPDATAALAQLLRLHTFSQEQAPVADAPPLVSLSPLLRVLLDEAEYERFASDADARGLEQILADTYAGRELAGRRHRTAAAVLASLNVEPLLARGITAFTDFQYQAGADPASLLSDLEDLRAAMVDFADAETALLGLPDRYGDDRARQGTEAWHERFAAVHDAGVALDGAVASLKDQGFEPDEAVADLLAAAERELHDRIDRQFSALIDQLPPGADVDADADDLRGRLQASRDATRAAADDRFAGIVDDVERLHGSLMTANRAMRRDEAGVAYQIRLAMYRDADDAFFGDDPPQVTLTNVADLLEAIESTATAAESRITDRHALADDASLDAAAETARWGLRLAGRANRTHLLERTLARLPADADALESAIAEADLTAAQAAGTWTPPRIPLSQRFSGQAAFPAGLHPEAFRRLAGSWAALADRAEPGADAASRLLDAETLDPRVRDAERRVVQPYVQRYIAYWSQGVLEDASPAPDGDWTELYERLSTLRAEVVQPELASLADQVALALQRVPERFLTGPERDELIAHATGQLTHTRRGFDEICNDVVRHWLNLTARTRDGELDIEAGVVGLKRMTPSDFRRDLLGGIVYADDPSEAPLRYWSELVRVALEAIADEGAHVAEDAKARLRGEHRGFPLYNLPGSEHLTMEQIRTAAADAAHLQAMIGRLDDEEPSRIGAGARTGLDRVDHQLGRISGAEIIVEDETRWLRSITRIALALTDAEQPLEAELFLLPASDQFNAPDWPEEAEAAIRPFRYVEIAGELRTTQRGADDPERSARLHVPAGEPFTLRFFRLDDDAEPAAEVSFDAPFGVLAATLQPGVVYEENEQDDGPPLWRLPLRVVLPAPDVEADDADDADDAPAATEEQVFFYWLGLRFDRPMPSPEAWPQP
ncbi:MAG: type VI secretion protein IcmF/TssM N-terminal domain-containing protein [Phycisphaeraceae bacterium]